jgi:hypothetical protein
MSGWQIAGTVMAVWFGLSALIAFGCALISTIRKSAPQPELSDGAVDAIFDAMVQDLKSKDGQS